MNASLFADGRPADDGDTRRWNHAITLAIAVESSQPDMPTLDEAMVALRARLAELEADPGEAAEALLIEVPFDTYEVNR